jgi:cytochrome b
VPADAPQRMRIWDAPTRLVHWAIAICFGMSWGTARWNHMEWHLRFGYAMLGLLLFRVFWGFFGSSTARFTSFIRGPREIVAHLTHLTQRVPTDVLGHNALGALSVLAMLLLLLTQVTLGLFAQDTDSLYSGSLSRYVSYDTSRLFAHYHARVFELLKYLVFLHIAALLFYTFYKRDRLIGAMITGSKPWQASTSDQQLLRFAPAWRLYIGAALAAAVAWYIS